MTRRGGTTRSRPRVGYRPQDRTVDFAAPEAFQTKPSDLPQVTDHFQGGWFSAQGHDEVERRRRVLAEPELILFLCRARTAGGARLERDELRSGHVSPFGPG